MEANQEIEISQTTADKAGLVFRTKAECFYFLTTQCTFSAAAHSNCAYFAGKDRSITGEALFLALSRRWL